MSALILSLLAQPVIRDFLMEVALRVFAEFYAKGQADPKFREQFTALATELANSKTEEEKINVLKKLKALNGPVVAA